MQAVSLLLLLLLLVLVVLVAGGARGAGGVDAAPASAAAGGVNGGDVLLVLITCAGAAGRSCVGEPVTRSNKTSDAEIWSLTSSASTTFQTRAVDIGNLAPKVFSNPNPQSPKRKESLPFEFAPGHPGRPDPRNLSSFLWESGKFSFVGINEPKPPNPKPLKKPLHPKP